MTPEQQEWDTMLSETWNGLPKDRDPKWRQREAHRLMIEHHGRRPSGPPWFLTLVGGKSVKKLWGWFNGKKTLLAAILVSVPVIWEGVAQILGASGMGPEQVAAIGGIVLGAIGLLHKVLKALGVAAPPEPKPTL